MGLQFRNAADGLSLLAEEEDDNITVSVDDFVHIHDSGRYPEIIVEVEYLGIDQSVPLATITARVQTESTDATDLLWLDQEGELLGQVFDTTDVVGTNMVEGDRSLGRFLTLTGDQLISGQTELHYFERRRYVGMAQEFRVGIITKQTLSGEVWHAIVRIYGREG